MSLDELNQRLEKFISEIDDNIVETSFSIYIEPLFPNPVQREMMRFNNGKIPKEMTTKALNYEKIKEWKELFNAYKGLINNPKAESFTKKFYDLTKKYHFYLFNFHLMNNTREHKEWSELHKE